MRRWIIGILAILVVSISIIGVGVSVYAVTKDDKVINMTGDIVEVLMSADTVELIENGNRCKIETDTFNNAINQTLEGAHAMPALGVALHEETIAAMQEGFWIELIYDKEYMYNEMPFDKLLIQVRAEDSGFNIIRHYNNKYDGRCYYVSLAGDMAGVAELFE
ncbi:MAG: hypothetical protein E7356_05275 [Clostridiales bacterium]|nr:hypothetical protein [Clostridiales bacterium]